MKSKHVLKIEQFIELWQNWGAFVELINLSKLLFMYVTQRELYGFYVIFKHLSVKSRIQTQMVVHIIWIYDIPWRILGQ